jgi:hypothetical protein
MPKLPSLHLLSSYSPCPTRANPSRWHLFYPPGLDLPPDEHCKQKESDDADDTEHKDDARVFLCEVFLCLPFHELVDVLFDAARDERVVDNRHFRLDPELGNVSAPATLQITHLGVAAGIKARCVCNETLEPRN